MENNSLERAVARFVVDYQSSDIDNATRASLKSLIKDQFAIMIGAQSLPWSVKTREFRNPHPGVATIVGEHTKATAVEAAYLNASYGHGFEYDDFFDNAHPGCAVVPAAFALGEETGATLEETMVALVVGYETYVRIGRFASPEVLNRGWQPHALFGNFGSAAIAAKLLKLDEEQTFNALAIALSHLSGPTEYASTGGSIKRIHAGICVRNGIEAAQLAKAGITGPRKWLTGDRGLYKQFAGKTVDEEALAAFAPSAPNFMPGLSFKPYCCCAGTFPFIEAMEKYRDRADDIEWVDVKLQTMADSIVGTRNTQIYQPRNIEELQYSLPAQMALAVMGLGNGYRSHKDFMDGILDLSEGSEALAMTKRMKLTVDPELDKYPYFVADVTLHFKDGSHAHCFEERAKGSPLKPYKEGEHELKLFELTEGVIGREQSERLFGLVDKMQPDSAVRDITRLLIPSN